MVNEKKELSEIQKFALQAAREKLVITQNQLSKIGNAVLRELSISEADVSKWQFSKDFSYIEKIKKEKPDLVIPSRKQKGGYNDK